jgi:hypothetical protein
MNSKRMNRLEELGRVDSEKEYTKKGKENLGAEKSRIVRELKADGGKAGSKKRESSSTKGNIRHGKLKSQKELKTITDSKKYKDASYGDKTKMLNVATMKKGGVVSETKKKQFKSNQAGQKATNKKVIKKVKDIVTLKSFHDLAERRARKFGPNAKGTDEPIRTKKAMGGSLKAIPSENKGLKKLPTQVRNKMGYMKNGGRAKMRSGGLAKRGRGCEIR